MKRACARAAAVGALAALVVTLTSCSSEDDVQPAAIAQGDYTVLAWNDLGMHCLNPTYDQAVILPPYNTLMVQVLRRGERPQVVGDGLTVEYRLLGNTYSSGKTDALGADFAGFWANDVALFGVDLAVDTGLNLHDPTRHNGLAGTMQRDGDVFRADGIPVTPVKDDGTWTPYQVAEITVKSGDTVLATTQATVPTSDEIACDRCHAQGGVATEGIGGGGANPFANILAIHDLRAGTHLVADAPVLCASCHASPALGTPAPADPEMYLSAAIHSSHADRGATCYDCHPGTQTSCNRSLAHTDASGHCTACHGELAQVGGSVVTGQRVPWVQEPACATCHTGVEGVATGAALYRNSRGHGGVYCTGCHGSPHAMYPSRVASDNTQPLQYQSAALSLGSCAACHDNSRGEGSDEFREEHGGAGGKASACRVCHTAIPGSGTGGFPHAFTWHARAN